MPSCSAMADRTSSVFTRRLAGSRSSPISSSGVWLESWRYRSSPIRCSARRARSSSRMISTSFAIMTSGSSTVAFEVAKSMIRSPNWWLGLDFGPADRGRPGPPTRSSSTVWPSLTDAANASSSSGRTRSRRSVRVTLKCAVLAARVLDPVVIGEGQVELDGLVHPQADDMVLPAGDHPVLAQDERQAVGGAAVEWLAVDRAPERDRHQVALLRRPRSSTGRRVACWPQQLLDDRRHVLIGDRRDLEAEGVVGVGARLDRRSDGHDRREPCRVALAHGRRCRSRPPAGRSG